MGENVWVELVGAGGWRVGEGRVRTDERQGCVHGILTNSSLCGNRSSGKAIIEGAAPQGSGY